MAENEDKSKENDIYSYEPKRSMTSKKLIVDISMIIAILIGSYLYIYMQNENGIILILFAIIIGLFKKAIYRILWYHMEIPRTVNYDFLLVAIGFILVVSVFYYNIFDYSREISFFVSVFGIISFAIGITEIKYNYDIDMEIKELETAKQINEYIQYFESDGVLSKKNKSDYIKEIKELIKPN